MARFKQVYKIIEDIVNGISWDIPIESIIDNGNGTYTLNLGCTAWLNKGKIFTDDSRKWRVESFVFNSQLTIKPYGHANAWSKQNLELNIPTYLHGTVRLANAEYYGEVRKREKTGVSPIIYLHSTIQERPTLSTKDAVEREATVNVFFIMDNNFKDWIRVNYDTEIFDPISNIEEKFIEGLLNNANIGKFTNERYERTNHEQFKATDGNDYFARDFDGELSALHLRIPLKINRCESKDFNC